MVDLVYFQLLSAALFVIGMYGVLARRSAVLIIMSIELMRNAVNVNLIAAASHWGSRSVGEAVTTHYGQIISISVTTVDEWHALCKAMKVPAWTKEERFSTFSGRRENQDELDSLLGQWTARHEARELMGARPEAGVAAGVVERQRGRGGGSKRGGPVRAGMGWAARPEQCGCARRNSARWRRPGT